jgi:hypothetical protein
MTATIAISDELRANVALRLKARPDLDPVAAAFEAGAVATLGARRRFHSTGQFPGLICKRPSPQRAPDKQAAYERRHRLAFSGPMPPHLAGRFTVAEMAVFRIVADEVRARGKCALSLAEISARGGTCRKTAQRALHRAQAEQLVRIELRPIKGKPRHLPNIVGVISADWASWIRRGVTGQNSPRTDINRSEDGCANDAASCDGAVNTNRPKRKLEVSKQAKKLAAHISLIVGYHSRPRPDSWCQTHVEHFSQSWLDQLPGVEFASDLISTKVNEVMRRKPQKCPPHSVRYFDGEVTRMIRRLAPLTLRC